jgi:hypothetical protein
MFDTIRFCRRRRSALARDLARSGSESCALVVPDNTEASDFTAGSVYGGHFHYWGEADGLS